MRDMKFISAVGATAQNLGVPVILAGSTLAHAYFALTREECTVLARGEKEHSKVRRNTSFGKIVRDKIPGRIAQRREAEVTRKIPRELKKSFLTSKLLEEALEVRNAKTPDEKRPRSLVFEDLGIRLDVTLKSDRIELHASREAEQLETAAGLNC